MNCVPIPASPTCSAEWVWRNDRPDPLNCSPPAVFRLRRDAGGFSIAIPILVSMTCASKAMPMFARVRALTAYKDFLTLWKDADPDIPILKQAKAEYAKLQ